MAEQPSSQRSSTEPKSSVERAPSTSEPPPSRPADVDQSTTGSATGQTEAELVAELYAAPVARVYDDLAGGKNALRSTREVTHDIVTLLPKLGTAARANADFVPRAVSAAAEAGFSQFLDLGCGFPHPAGKTVLHSASQHRPDARVVYVDHDPMVMTHGRALLERPGAAWCVEADARDTARVLGEARKHLDFERPTVVIMAALVHFWADHEDPYGIVDAYLEAFPSGWLIFTHACADGLSFRERAKALKAYARTAPLYLRSEAAITAFLDGCAVLEPGLVEASAWRPEPGPDDVGEAHFLAAVAEFRGGGSGN